MRRLSLRTGFSSVETVIIVAVVAVLCALGYALYSNTQEQEATKSAIVTDVVEAPTITTTPDLDKASVTIDDTELESSNENDLYELEKELAEF